MTDQGDTPIGAPPRLAEGLLRMVLPVGVVGDSIIGDVREEFAEYVRRGGFAPRLWCWTHIARLTGSYAITRGREVEMTTLLNDLKFGARSLLRMPGSAAVAIVVLAIGIGLCSSMFSMVYGIYFRGMDLPEAHRFYLIYETSVERNQLQRNVPIENLYDWRERQSSFEGMFGLYGGTVNVAGADQPVRFQGAYMHANAFSVLGVSPVIGRAFVPGDDTPGAPPNIVLGYTAWRDHYGRDRSVVGTDVRVNGEPATVVGVMPEGFEFPNNTEVWVPLRDDPLATERGQGRYLTVYGRLADGVERARAAQEIASIARQLESEYPVVNDGIGAQLYTISEANTDRQLNVAFGAMMFAVFCVLLVACANVANLLLARAALRTKETGVRVALGGSRFRVMLPFFAEALVLSLVGAGIGMFITYFGVSWFDRATDPALTGRPWFMQFEVDLPILAFVVVLSMFTAIIAGIIPALLMSKTDVSAVLKDESRGSSGRIVGRLSRVLVTAEVALSMALLVGAGLMTKSIIKLGDTEYPFATEDLLTARVGLFQADYPDRQARQEFWTELTRQLGESTEISSAALTSILPYAGRNTFDIAIDGVRYDQPSDHPDVPRVVVTPSFFETVGVELIGGRDFNAADEVDSELVAIVNQPMVERYFAGQSPLGRRFREGVSDTLPLITIVGVAPDLLMSGPQIQGEEFEPAGYYVPLGQTDSRFMSIAARARNGVAATVTDDVRAAVGRADSELPIYDVFSEAEVVERRVWFFGVIGTVFIVFGAAALFMASVGLYGVLSFAVSRRTQEMGIRMALGAASRDVVGLVVRQGVGQLGVGLAIGAVLAFALTRVTAALMYQVDPQDPTVFATVLVLIAAVGVAAAIIPARRATTVDPVQSLRSE